MNKRLDVTFVSEWLGGGARFTCYSPEGGSLAEVRVDNVGWVIEDGLGEDYVETERERAVREAATLWRAAPDLLAVAEFVAKLCERDSTLANALFARHAVSDETLQGACLAAIAKARGEDACGVCAGRGEEDGDDSPCRGCGGSGVSR